MYHVVCIILVQARRANVRVCVCVRRVGNRQRNHSSAEYHQ